MLLESVSMEYFKELLKNVEFILKKFPFKKNGTSFFILINGSWCKLGFQKSVTSSKSLTKFTINIGISLAKVNEHLGTSNNNPAKLVFQLGDRVNFFLPKNEPIWWELSSTHESLMSISQEIVNVINSTIIPLFEKYTKLNNVIDLCTNANNHRWFNGDFSKISLLILLLLESDPSKVQELKESLKIISQKENMEEEFNEFIEKHFTRT